MSLFAVGLYSAADFREDLLSLMFLLFHKKKTALSLDYANPLGKGKTARNRSIELPNPMIDFF